MADEPLYYVTTASSSVVFAQHPDAIPTLATILRPEQVDPDIRQQGRDWLAERRRTPSTNAPILAAARQAVADYLAAAWPLTVQASKHGQLDATRIHSAFSDPEADTATELSLYDLAKLLDPTLGLAKECPECGAHGAELAWGSTTRVDPSVGHGQLRATDVTPVVFLGCPACSATVLTIDTEQFLALVVPVLP